MEGRDDDILEHLSQTQILCDVFVRDCARLGQGFSMLDNRVQLGRSIEHTGVVARLHRGDIGRLEYGGEELDVFRLVLSDLLEERSDIVVPCLVEAVLIELGEPLGVKTGLEVLESECVVENDAIIGGAGGETLALDEILKVAALQLLSGVDGSERNSVDGGSNLKRKGSGKSKLHGWKVASVRSAEVKKRKPSRVGGAHPKTVHVISQRCKPRLGKSGRTPGGSEA